jgi:Family of unknown function (DUF5681)
MGSELTQFKPGDEWKGNANGRPKGSLSLTTLIKQALQGNRLGQLETPDGRSIAEHFADHVIGQAMNGNGALMKEVMDRVDGRIPDAKAELNRTTDIVAEAQRRAKERRESLKRSTP